ncbi:hypothetical protein HJC23_000285 [Cyclotella cryptica]|uniref:Ribosomal protein L1 n=1 Tax=Cyclotella cryptica TaxID=29204 RepID=A0ABD3QC73_9STRA|eukprot:CCRYP_006858-RA/>CCRYP_006858-RA protein AED:0.09 eAED:0.09 QI:126/1/1/1/1/1/2/133/534
MGAQSKPTSAAGSIDPTLLNKAVAALLKHHASTSSTNQLLDDQLDVQVQFTLARVPGNPSPKPIRIDIPHPLIKLDSSTAEDADILQEAQVCLIVKEDSKPLVQEMIARFPNELSCIKKVLGLQSLRTKHKSFAQKRELLHRFDIFLADDRILPMLTKALGSKFFEKKKQPVPLNICREEALPFAVQKCLKGTFMYLSSGTCVTVKAGNTSMPSHHLEANIIAICTQAPLKVPRKWSNIKSISIKTTSSVALPVYNKTLEELEEIRALAVTDADVVIAGKDVDDKAEKMDKEKKRKELAEKSPLARALKKQKSVKEEITEKETTRSSTEKKVKTKDSEHVKIKASKKRKEKHNIDDVNADELDATTDKELTLKTTKETKLKKKDSDGAKNKLSEKNTDKRLVDGENAPKTPEGKKATSNDKDGVKSKSSKKRKDKQTENDNKSSSDDKIESSTKKAKESNAHGSPFIASKKYQGSKKGYVFRKDKMGIGYYLDELPVVDKDWLASLKKGSGKGGGRKSMSHTPKKRKGKSRTSY